MEFEFRDERDRHQAAVLMRHLRGMEISEVMEMLQGYGRTIFEADEVQKYFHTLTEDELR